MGKRISTDGSLADWLARQAVGGRFCAIPAGSVVYGGKILSTGGRRRQKILSERKSWAATADSEEKKRPLWEQLARRYGISDPGGAGQQWLLAIHGYFALVVKLVVWKWTEVYCSNSNANPSAPPSPDACYALETGQTSVGRLLGLDGENWFSWYLHLPSRWRQTFWTYVVLPVHAQLADLLPRWTSAAKPEGDNCPVQWAWIPDEWADRLFRDHFQRLYSALLPGLLRRRWEEYATPDGLARHVLRMAGYRGMQSGRLLEPACGSGSFLLAALYLAWENASLCPAACALAERPTTTSDGQAKGGCPSAKPADLSEWLRGVLEGIVGWDRSVWRFWRPGPIGSWPSVPG